MHTITFVSTVHEENGKCNADKLCSIFEKLSPEVVFLEALGNTYSAYEEHLFSSFGISHRKLEIKAIQKYREISSIEYIPVLDSGLSDLFDNKYNLVCENIQFQKMLDDFNSLASEQGFQFLNSADGINLQEEMRTFEYRVLNDNHLNEAVNEDINAYENSMMRNIYAYCRNNQFDKGIFLCGVAHRHSIIKKIESFSSKENMDLKWVVYGT